ncbi:MAG: cell division protein FtsA [Nitrospirae bacterium]|nr:MAG: cell division protein FtsA [Nitrospirota bacterium]
MPGRGRVIGLDVGTTKVCAMVGDVDERGLHILGLGTAESKGLRKGIVVNIEYTVESIERAVREAEEMTGVNIRSVYVGIAGGHIKSFESYGATGIKGAEVTEADIERVLDAAKAVYVPLDREVLHVIPVEYTVDGEGGIINPLGMSGVRLEAKVQIVTGSVTAVQNLIRCCEKAGLEVVDIVLEPLASALATLTDSEKQDGVVLVDIGGGTTDVAFYRDGVLKNTSVIAIGGNHITNDIAIGLRLPVEEAERIKMQYGSALPIVEGKEDIEIKVPGRQHRSIPVNYLNEIINPRCEELFEILKKELQEMGVYDSASYGLVLTGGASKLKGMDRLAEAVIGMPVRRALPGGVEGLKEVVQDPKYSTGVGLLIYGMKELEEPIGYGDIFAKVLSRMKEWVKGFIKGRV